MFFYFQQQQTAKILPFKITPEPNYIIRNPLPKLSDAKKDHCQRCGETADRLVFYDADYIGDPNETIDYFDNKKWIETKVCDFCFALLCPDCDF
jgi:hypothetical protein